MKLRKYTTNIYNLFHRTLIRNDSNFSSLYIFHIYIITYCYRNKINYRENIFLKRKIYVIRLYSELRITGVDPE